MKDVIDQANIRVDPIGIIGDEEVIEIFEANEETYHYFSWQHDKYVAYCLIKQKV